MTDENAEEFNAEQIKTYWLTEAQEALKVADHLIEKKDYSYALFFGHLAIEKLCLNDLHPFNKSKKIIDYLIKDINY